jgi:hypothetical protein
MAISSTAPNCALQLLLDQEFVERNNICTRISKCLGVAAVKEYRSKEKSGNNIFAPIAYSGDRAARVSGSMRSRGLA